MARRSDNIGLPTLICPGQETRHRRYLVTPEEMQGGLYLSSTVLTLEGFQDNMLLLSANEVPFDVLRTFHLSTVICKARGYAYPKIEYVKIRTYLSKNRIRVWYVSYTKILFMVYSATYYSLSIINSIRH